MNLRVRPRVKVWVTHIFELVESFRKLFLRKKINTTLRFITYPALKNWLKLRFVIIYIFHELWARFLSFSETLFIVNDIASKTKCHSKLQLGCGIFTVQFCCCCCCCSCCCFSCCLILFSWHPKPPFFLYCCLVYQISKRSRWVILFVFGLLVWA